MSDNTTANTLTRVGGKNFRQTTLKVPMVIHKAVAHAAVDRNVDVRDIWLEGVRKLLGIKEDAAA